MRRLDPWKALGVKPGDDLDELKAAYKRTMLAVHPDHGGDRESASDANRAFAFFMHNLTNGRVPTPEQAGIVSRPPMPWPPTPPQWSGRMRVVQVVIVGGGAATTTQTGSATTVSFFDSPWGPTGGRRW